MITLDGSNIKLFCDVSEMRPRPYITTDRGRQFESELFRAITSMVGARHFHTTSYHPIANGMIERAHRQLKASIMCHNTSMWTEVLPIVLLGMRSCWKEDVQASPAELVYGEPLRLPGQFIAPSTNCTVEDITSLATRLAKSMANLAPKPATWHRNGPFYVPKDLRLCTHVFVRQDRVRRSLEPPYTGPCRVIDRQEKYFKIILSGRETTVSIDRLKPAYVVEEKADEVPATISSPATAPSTAIESEKCTRSGRRVRFPDYYRP